MNFGKGFLLLLTFCPFAGLGMELLSISFTTIPLQNVWEISPPPPYLSPQMAYPMPFALPLRFDSPISGECCGFLWRAGISFTTRDRELDINLTFREIPFLCCGMSFDAAISLTTPGKTITISPKWEGGHGPSLEIYGDLLKFEIYGWGLQYDIGFIHIRELFVLDPDRMWRISPVPFYPGEREYWGVRYIISPLTLTSEFWWGEGNTPFNLRRTRLSVVFPIYEGFQVIVEGEWEFSGGDPFDLLNIRWEVEF